ncbi:hypothetical protein GGR54DRAFT_630762 [Hypoxylon sp. NC1633]|nr:hypothetical protein GGR54DRAFT_630762 [Hypoxylon sp. NC1633]
MATEPILSQPDEPLTEPAHAQSSATSNDIHDVSHSNTTLNGTAVDPENKQIADIVDDTVNSADVSVSGGSDTESSKARLEDKNHARTSSTIKRPQSFKSVSVNRTFLAAKNSANSFSRQDASAGLTSTAPQPTPSSSASRLKFVMKSGSSLGGSAKTPSSNGKPGGVPDPNTVWNRNRPVSQPEQKKLSDEELVHKYGIHMAGRLGPEDTKGQSNWADIDDDEEWAPETITWTDGTKITLPHADEIAPGPNMALATPSKEAATTPTPATPNPKSPMPNVSTVPSGPHTSGSAGTGPPSVKPGALASGKSLVLKGAPERPTLVAKPPAPPTPTKSPWAPLPPVEKVPPGQVEAPFQASASRPPARDWASNQSTTPPPTKEIAADDFSRSGFREGRISNNQLFNSQSGHLEPVMDRRGQRNDAHGRQPAVLQRPQQYEQQGPAQPSAAFQTSRTSTHEGPYRRRGSSNVSGTSGGLSHKLGKPHDFPLAHPEPIQSRSGSVATAGADSPLSARTFSPANIHQTPRPQPVHPYLARPSPGAAEAVPSYNAPTAEPLSDVNEIELQKKIMAESREQAMRRKVDEEEREEQARKARIERLKILGPLPEGKSTKKDDSVLPTYGRRTDTSVQLPVNSANALGSPAERTLSMSKTTPFIGSVKPVVNGQINSQGESLRTQIAHVPKAQQPVTSWPEAPQHPPQHSERFPSWGSSQNSTRNVWGAPGNDRSLGNGTFNPDLGTLPDSHPAAMSERSHRPVPIGPPRPASQRPGRPEPLPGNRLAPIGPPRSQPSHVHQASKQGSTSQWKSFVSDVEDDDQRARVEMQGKMDAQKSDKSIPMGDNWDDRVDEQNVGGPKDSSNSAKAAGTTDAAALAAAVEAVTVANRAAQARESAAIDEALEAKHQLAKAAANRRLMPTDFAVIGATQNAARDAIKKGLMPTDFAARSSSSKGATKETNGIHPESGRPPAVGHAKPTAPGRTSQLRSGSRFFPAARETKLPHGGNLEIRTKSPTPPPPTADGHPVFDGDVSRPHVALPPARPIVKLPPATGSAGPSPVVPAAKPAPISFAAAAAAAPTAIRASLQPALPRAASRGVGYGGIPQKPHEIASQENWQDRINNLMGRKTTLPAKSLAVDSSSRIALEHTQSYDPATVALPYLSYSVSSVASDDGDYISREMAEECFGEQEMGSLPAVRLPSDAPDALWQAVEPNYDPMPVRLRVDATAAEALRFQPEMSNGKSVIRVSAPFMPEAKTFLLPFAASNRSGSSPRRAGPRGAPRRLSGRGGQRGGREHPDHAADHVSSPSANRPPSTRGGRGGYRPRTENWGRHASAASAAQS